MLWFVDGIDNGAGVEQEVKNWRNCKKYLQTETRGERSTRIYL